MLTQGITTSVGAEVCARIQAWFPRDQAFELIVHHIHDREKRGDWPLAPLPAYLIPWVGAAARRRPDSLHPTTIRRLWLADPVRAWNVTQTMLDSGHRFVHHRAVAAMDAGWGTGHDAAMATTLRSIILEHQYHLFVLNIGIATAISGIGIAPPSLITALLTELAMQGNENVQRRLISALHRGWGRGQDDLVWRIVAIIAERDSSGPIWADSHETLIRAWNYHPPHVVVSLADRLLTRATNRLANKGNHKKRVGMMWMAEAAIAAFAPGWTHLPTTQVIERIAHHVARLHAHARTLDPSIRDRLVSAWARVIAASAERLSTSDLHAVLEPLWTLSPDWYLDGVVQGVRR